MDDAFLALGLAALGQPIRMALYRRLVEAGAAGAGPVFLAGVLGTQQNLVSYHLGPLVAARLVVREKRGREMIYRADPVALNRLAAALLELSQA